MCTHTQRPPQNELRSRTEFLDLQQGKHDVHAYAQRARYLVSNVVTDPTDEATKVVTFMKRLRDALDEYPSTLEAAIALAIQEEFSLRQAKLHTNVPCPPRPAAKTEGPEPMDLSYASAVGQQKNKGSNVRCFRCGNMDVSVKSMTKRADSLRVLVDSGPSNNFVRQQSRPLLDFEERHMPRSQLEVRLATGAIVKT
ncbi:hypothetical protein PHMEG_00029462 [Phytophthora megakarya]|uniref:Retrotransposon gag domain-containing protein n=1 Tax=Phytophthora megakarya TaxID=4795 RepID=A0A225V2M0_9STRA|nr:hypothetical protein PHMEG_00029462 [Phytophthora megakarya]